MAKTLACIVTDPVGLYATPAMDLIEVAKTFDSDFTLTYSGKTVNLKSMMGVLSLGIPTKAKIVITADGDDEETGIKADNLELIYTVKKPYKGTFYKVHICKCNIKKDSIILQEGETIDYKWVTKDEFIKTIELDNFITPDKDKLSNFIKTLYY